MDDSLKSPRSLKRRSPRPRVSASPRLPLSASPRPPVPASPRLPLLALLLAFLITTAVRQDPAAFGYFHDDTIYFSSAKALASGQSYVNPSIPGTPAQSKYPALYPLLLSAVWKLNPQFPDNLTLAFWLTALFGTILIAGWFFLARDLGAGPREALLVTAILAFHPFLLSLVGALLSDVPFMAFAVWAAVLAGHAVESRRMPLWLGSAACAVAAVLTRSIGITVIAGIALWAIRRRAYRWALLFLAITLPVFLAALWWSQTRHPALDGLPGYRQTMLFYTSYAGFWKLSVPDFSAFAAMLGSNFLEILKSPALLCFPLPHLPENLYVQAAVVLALSAGVWFSVARLGMRPNWPPVFFVFAFYAVVVLVWNYPLANRFLLVFVPLFLLGAFQEAWKMRRKLVGAVIAVLLLDSAYGYVWEMRELMDQAAADRRSLAGEKREAYEWIRAHTAPADRFISYEDASLYLYTGRQALRPIAFSSQANYRDSAAVMHRDFARLADTARQIHARYWLVAADDYQLEYAAQRMQEETARLLKPFPVVFQTGSGAIRIYQIVVSW